MSPGGENRSQRIPQIIYKMDSVILSRSHHAHQFLSLPLTTQGGFSSWMLLKWGVVSFITIILQLSLVDKRLWYTTLLDVPNLCLQLCIPKSSNKEACEVGFMTAHLLNHFHCARTD